MVLPQFAHDSQSCIVFWVNTFNNKWSPVFVAGGPHGGLTSRWERRGLRSLSLLLAGV